MRRLINNILYRKRVQRLHTAYIRVLNKPESPRRQALLKQEQAK